jgi:polyisoprenoid-binding protein YceI
VKTRVLLLLLTTSAAAEPFQVAARPHGSVKFKVEGPLDDVLGETRQVGGKLELDPASWSSGKAWVAVELGSLKTGIDQRDEDMRNEFLQVARFPFALLAIDKLERPSAPSLSPGQTVEGDAVGSFELHGVRRAVRVPVKLRMEPDRKIWVTGAIEVPFADYNISRPQRLFIKLGDVAEVSFEVLFAPNQAEPVVAAEAPKAPAAPTVAAVLPAGPKVKPRPPRKPKPALTVAYLFDPEETKGKGERMFHSPELGGAGNKLSCGHCHAKTDERAGLVQKDGHARAGSTMFNAAQRPKFWNGFAGTVGKAANICQKMFMRGTGLSDQQQAELTSFVQAISPDPAPELDFRTVYRTYESAIRDPIGGDPVHGKALADQYCMTCHLDGRIGPVFAPGLYEPDWVVSRVRHLEGHGDDQMPAFSIARLPDSDLRDIVTFLTNPKVAPPVFDRKKSRASAK